MKITKMFKMDLENGCAEFVQSPEFYYQNSLLKLDILKDWIEDLKNVYNKEIDNFENELKRNAKDHK
jgi:hypothetical protein|tara:strand:- start:79 stop:279 length:201 start_codon:yes stop_codon:yes gene_type:complete